VMVSNGCGATVAATASCTITLAFKPTLAGAKAANLSVVTNSAINPTQTVALTGTGVAPDAAVSPASLVFAAQNLNSTSAAKAIVLTNNGGAMLQNIAVSTTGVFARKTTGLPGNANSCGATLAPAASCNIFVTFTPTVGGNATGTVVIASNDPVKPSITVPASGWGNFPKATGVTVAANPASPAFPGTSVVFTAAGSGGTAGSYLYQFSLFDGATWTTVQAYSSTATWTWNMPLTQMPGNYTIRVQVQTNPGPNADAQATRNYTVTQFPVATGVTLSASPTSPQTHAAGLSITFTAVGSGSAFPYQYQFILTKTGPGGSTTLVQDWSSSATWTWNNTVTPSTNTAGSYTVQVKARTSQWQTVPVTRTLNYTLN